MLDRNHLLDIHASADLSVEEFTLDGETTDHRCKYTGKGCCRKFLIIAVKRLDNCAISCAYPLPPVKFFHSRVMLFCAFPNEVDEYHSMGGDPKGLLPQLANLLLELVHRASGMAIMYPPEFAVQVWLVSH